MATTTECASLGQVCDFLDSRRVPVREDERKPGPYPYYGANGRQGWIDNFIFDETLVLLAEDGGHFGSKTKPISYLVRGKTWVNNHAHVLRPHKNCDASFLHHMLSYYDVTKYVNGTTRQKLTKSNAQAILVPFPKLPEQKRIAAVLEKADRLRRMRRYARQLSDTFLQSVFIEMFGDPLINSLNWDMEPLGEKLTFLTSGSRGWAKYYSGKGDLFLRIQNVGKNRLLLDDVTFVQPPKNAEGIRTVVQAGDVLLSITADLGRAAAVPQDLTKAYINQHLALLRLQDVEPVFVAALLSSNAAKRQWDSLDRSAVKSGLNFDDIRGFKMISPPIPLQQKFAAIARRFERLRAQQRETERQAEHLFQTLLDRAFGADGL